jgi:hypothetical protein
LIFQFLNAFEFLFFFFKSLFFFGIFFGFLPPFDRFSGDPFGIRVKALSLEPLDPYTLAVRAEEGSWGAGKLELDAQRFAQRVAKKKQNIYIYISYVTKCPLDISGCCSEGHFTPGPPVPGKS